MIDVSAKVDVSELLANIDKLPQALVTGLTGGMQLAVELVERGSVARVKKRTTALSTSIQSEVEVSDTDVRGYVGALAEHAPYVHEGTGLYAKSGNGRKDVPWVYCDEQGNFYSTKGQKPNPFIQDTIDAERDNILKCFQGVLGK